MIYGNFSIIFSPSRWILKNQKDKSIKKLDWCGSNYEGNLGCWFNNETKIQHLKEVNLVLKGAQHIFQFLNNKKCFISWMTQESQTTYLLPITFFQIANHDLSFHWFTTNLLFHQFTANGRWEKHKTISNTKVQELLVTILLFCGNGDHNPNFAIRGLNKYGLKHSH